MTNNNEDVDHSEVSRQRKLPVMTRLLQKVLFPSRQLFDHERMRLAQVISGKSILITGASYGIGEQLAYLLASPEAVPLSRSKLKPNLKSNLTSEMSCQHSQAQTPLDKRYSTPRLILVGRTHQKLKEVQNRVGRLGGVAEIHCVDLRDDQQLSDFIQYLQTQSIDVFINNAGKSIRRPVMQSLERSHDYERTISLNYLAPVKLCLCLIPKLRENKGHIINVSALNVLLPPMPDWSAYQASKTAFDQWFRSASPELNANNISTSTLYLPLVRTRMIAPTKMYNSAPAMTPEQVASLIGRLMIKRKSQFRPWWLYIVEPLAVILRAPLAFFVQYFYRNHTRSSK